MCGRFVAATDPDGLVRFFTFDERKADDLPPSYNVAPNIRPEGDGLLAFAGLWDTWTDATQTHEGALRTYTILTRSAEGPVAALHDRMPLAPPRDAWSAWLRSSTQAAEVATLLHASPPVL